MLSVSQDIQSRVSGLFAMVESSIFLVSGNENSLCQVDITFLLIDEII